jgi:hypothetical protein
VYRVAATAAVLLAAGCASAAARAPMDVPAGRAPTPADDVAREVAALLSGDPTAARAAETSLVALDGPGRAALARHAASIPTERDPRWLHVLDAHGLLPPLAPDEAVAFRLAEAARGEPGLLARARAALETLARRDPAPLVARLRPGPGADLLALALGDAGVSAAPALARWPATPARPRAGGAGKARDRPAPRSASTPVRGGARATPWTGGGARARASCPPRRHPAPADRPNVRRPRSATAGAPRSPGAGVLGAYGAVVPRALRAARADEPAVAAAEHALEAGDVAAALAAFRTLVETPDGAKDPRVLAGLGAACLRAGAPRDALDPFGALERLRGTAADRVAYADALLAVARGAVAAWPAVGLEVAHLRRA